MGDWRAKTGQGGEGSRKSADEDQYSELSEVNTELPTQSVTSCKITRKARIFEGAPLNCAFDDVVPVMSVNLKLQKAMQRIS